VNVQQLDFQADPRHELKPARRARRWSRPAVTNCADIPPEIRNRSL